MVDILIDGSNAGIGSLNQLFSQSCDIHIGSDKYVFFLPDANTLAYRKSTSDGETPYAAEVVVFQNVLQNIKKVAFHFDQDTPGVSRNLIHWAIVAREDGGTNTSSRQYRNLDTTNDQLSPAVSIGQGGVNLGFLWSAQALSITVARSGRICIVGHIAAGGTDNWFVVSDDGGLTFTPGTGAGSLATPIDGAALIDKHILVPGNETNLNDVYDVHLDVSAAGMTVKRYDTDGDVWTEVVFPAGQGAGTMVANDGEYLQYAATVRASDNHILVNVRNNVGVAGQDINLFEITNATTIAALTAPQLGISNVGAVGLNVDRVSGDIRHVQLRGSVFESSMFIETLLSTDNGVSWGPRVQYNEDADDDTRYVGVSLTQSLSGGRFMPVWHIDDLSDMVTNFNNSVSQPPVPDPPPPPPPPIIPGGGSASRSLSGSPAGFMTYITPDGRLYPLHTPHEFGRWVVSFSGFGTPPIQYITQRGPFQHGETVKDFFLRPRIIQLLIRQEFIDRSGWWAGRATLLDEIRPNRQATATAALPGQLRVVQTDGTIRDLDVFISEGPRFEPRVGTRWDEHAFTEVLRFIAHNPVAFDPNQVTVNFALSLDLNLVFPITFPIQFGSGEIDDTQNVTYVGTWEEFPVITVVGPIENFRLDNVTTGEKIEFGANIGPGRTVTIDLRLGFKTVVDDLGTNLIGIVTSDSDLATWHLAPDPEAPLGVNALRLRGNNPTGTTSVTLRYFDRYFGF